MTATRPPRATPTEAPRSALDRFFKISERGSTAVTEIRGGLVTFVTMVYIVVLNPFIIGGAPDHTGHFLGGGEKFGNFPAIAAVTALVAAVMTLAMGIVGRYPFALATGLGLNAFVTYSVASRMSWADAMGMVVIEGLVITALVLTGFRTAVFNAIPAELKSAIAVGIGLFIALIGLADGGIVQRVRSGAVLQLGHDGNLRGWPAFVFVFCLAVTAILMVRKVKGAILIGIASSTVLAFVIQAVHDQGNQGAPTKPNPLGWVLTTPTFDNLHFGAPDLGLFGKVSLGGGFSAVGAWSGIVLIFSLVLSDFFDVMGTTIGLASEAKLLDEKGNLPGVTQVLLIDGLAAVGGGVASASSATTYVESASGIGDGARTGLSSVTTGLLFVVMIFLSPLANVIPAEAATPALVIVGVLMMSQIKNIDFSDMTIAVPAFLTMILMPFTYSITNGVGAGFVSFVVLRAATGKAKSVHPLLWGIAIVFAIYFALEPLKSYFGIS